MYLCASGWGGADIAYSMPYRPHPIPRPVDPSRCGADPGRTIDVDVRPCVGILRWHWYQRLERTRKRRDQTAWCEGWQAGYDSRVAEEAIGSHMSGGTRRGRGRFWRSGPVSDASAMVWSSGPKSHFPPRAPPKAVPLWRGFCVRIHIAGTSVTGPDRQNRPRLPPTPPPLI